MSTTLWYLGHSGVVLEADGKAVAVDPFLTGNPVAVNKVQEIRCQSVAVTHGHADHIGDTVAIAKANSATVYAAFEICEFLAGEGCKTSGGNPGGRIETDFGWIAFTQAFHSSSYQGKYMGMPCGLVIHIGGVTVYHCGDTGIFSDMKLIGEIYRPDIACIPVGDRFTMGPELGARAAEMIGAKIAVPIHYKTWPPLAQDISAFKPAGVEVRELKPGEKMACGN